MSASYDQGTDLLTERVDVANIGEAAVLSAMVVLAPLGEECGSQHRQTLRQTPVSREVLARDNHELLHDLYLWEDDVAIERSREPHSLTPRRT